MSGVVTHGIGARNSVPAGYFSRENILYLQQAITKNLAEFKQKVILPEESILRICQRVIQERLESIPRMNRRVIMLLTNEIRTHQINNERHLRWEYQYFPYGSSQLVNLSAEMAPFSTSDIRAQIPLNKVGSTMRFYFT